MTRSFDWYGVLESILEFLRSSEALGLAVTLAIFYAVYRLVVYLARRNMSDEAARLTVRKWARYVFLWAALLWVLVVYGMHRQKDIFFVIGIFLAAVAISLRDVFSNFIGWMVIMASRVYRERDRVSIGDVSGDVIDIGLFRTVLAEIGQWVDADQSTGRLVAVPNKTVLETPVYNYTEGHDYIWSEFKVLVTFSSNWKRAEEIILAVAQVDFEAKEERIKERLKRARSLYYVTYTFITPKVWVSIADSGVLLTARYLVRARRRRTLDDTISREVLSRFASESDIEFAYPSLAVYRPGTNPAGGPGGSLHTGRSKS
jgi:small-conductance mechanosensitive channel